MASKPDTQQLFRQYGEEVRRFLARKLSCADTAEDLTQETFARLLRIDSDIIIEDGRAFIYKTAKLDVTCSEASVETTNYSFVPIPLITDFNPKEASHRKRS